MLVIGVLGVARYNMGMVGGSDSGLVELDNFVCTLKKDFSQYKFFNGKRFTFRPPRTIILEPAEDFLEMPEKYKLSVLHELGHAISEHKFYATDPERLKMEREAWEKAKGLCSRYGVVYDTEYAEEELDTYREWLHQKSKCSECGLTRYQTKDGQYHCPGCEG